MRRVNDSRRGDGILDKGHACHGSDETARSDFGTSICYTKQETRDRSQVTSSRFYDREGVPLHWYFHFMPVGIDAATGTASDGRAEKYMYLTESARDPFERGRQTDLLMDFQNDGEFVGGCIAEARLHAITMQTAMWSPCVFIHYSGAKYSRRYLF